MNRTLRILGALFLAWLLGGCDRPTASKDPSSAAAPATPPTVSSTAVSDHLAAAPPPAPAPAPAAPVSARTKVVADPSELDVLMVFYDWLGQEPPVSKWAEQEWKVRSSDEFRKAGNQAEVENNLRSMFSSLKDTGTVKVNINAQLSEYDPKYGEYYIDAFAPGHSLQFGKYNEQVQIQVLNASDAYAWKLAAADAQRVLERNRMRMVTIGAELKIRGARRSGDDGGILSVDVVRYSVNAGLNGVGALGSVDVPLHP